MAKDTRIIISAAWIGNTLYSVGKEDELQAAATPEQLAHLEKQGAIVGDWGTSAEPEPAADGEPAEETDADETPSRGRGRR